MPLFINPTDGFQNICIKSKLKSSVIKIIWLLYCPSGLLWSNSLICSRIFSFSDQEGEKGDDQDADQDTDLDAKQDVDQI